MANLKEKKLQQLKKTYVIGSMAGFIVILTIVLVTFAAMLAIFALYIMDSKLRDEYSRAQSMAQMYTLSENKNSESVLDILDNGRNYYIVVDKDNRIIKEHGADTCDLTCGGVIDIMGIVEIDDGDPENGIKSVSDTIMVYPDSQMRVITPTVNGRVWIDITTLAGILTDAAKSLGNSQITTPDFVRLPFWVEVPLVGGDRIICKSHFVIYFREIAILTLMALAIALLCIAMFICLIVYIVKTIRTKRRMNEVFYMDEVTNRHNWMWFLTSAEKILTHKRNASNLYAVLDIVFVNYRNFCVCHSVKVGEEMLIKVDETIQSHLERKKEISAHHSAAHFAALLRYKEINALEMRIKDMIADLEKIDDDHKFSFWVGVDRIPDSRDAKGKVVKRSFVDIEREYNNAGAARATITGDDSAVAFFDEKMVEEQQWIDMINENQEKALENEEFVVYYQPKYDPRTEILKGAEALIRWKSPERGMISPGRFIPIFEKNGFITQIDHYMLRHVARDQKTWLDSGCKCVPVSVNVSRAHFIESDLAEQIRDIVDEAGTPHELIEIELTESAFFDDKNALVTTIKKLKEYGFAVSMDDFGSGYSSLNSLKEMPLDVLKLDADFFRNDDADGRGKIVVSEAIKLAKSLNMRTVAEGIEERGQVDFLAEQGCDMIQGFYFARPMPREEFAGRMA